MQEGISKYKYKFFIFKKSNQKKKRTIVGLTQYSNKNHIARATLEAVCFQSSEVIEAMCKDSGVSLNKLKVDGGMTKSDLTLQIQADISNIEVSK